jgi:hypothetical protein
VPTYWQYRLLLFLPSLSLSYTKLVKYLPTQKNKLLAFLFSNSAATVFTWQRYIESDIEIMIIHCLNLSDVDERIIHYLNLSEVEVVMLNYLHHRTTAVVTT